MLLGNCISGVSLSWNELTRCIVGESFEIELYQSFGATKQEAMSSFTEKAIEIGTLPVINTMRVTGLISIPGFIDKKYPPVGRRNDISISSSLSSRSNNARHNTSDRTGYSLKDRTGFRFLKSGMTHLTHGKKFYTARSRI